jgi:hypothetical protein
VDPKAEEGFLHGRSLDGLLTAENFSAEAEASAEAVGVFAWDGGNFLGFLERKNGKWRYGHVFAGN